MLSPRLTNCKGCADIPDLLRRIDCKLAELGNNLYNNVVFMLNKPIAVTQISELLVYKRVLMFRYCDTHYATRCPEISTEDIASKVIRLTAGYVSFCNEPTVCEITTCAITPCPNPTTTTTSTSSTSTTSTTSTSSTTTSTTTLNCNFTGVIDCSITTTTTTTPPPTTTTTTSYFPDPFGVPCIWSTDGGNPGSVAVYDFDTNTSTTVLVPNDFSVTVGIERPICATEDKLWLVSVVDQGSNPTNDNDDKVYIREWDIDATGALPILTYVREITVPTGQYSGSNLGGSSVWAMTAIDNDTLILGTGNEYAPAPQEGTGGTGQIYLLEFSIAGSGDITIASNDISSEWAAAPGTNTSKLSNLTYTNSGQLVLGYRVDLTPSGEGQQYAVGNYLSVFPVTPSSPDFTINNKVIPKILLQNYGLPEFSAGYNGPKGVPFWGVNGLAQVLQPETLDVYTISLSIPNNLTLTTSVNSSNDWLSSAAHCSNITFVSGDPNPNCGLTYFPNLFDGLYNSSNNNYLGPQTFTYFEMTCTASLSNNLGAWWVSNTDGGFLGCSGLQSPDSEGEDVLLAVQGNDFSITIDFPVPMNNVPIRASVLNSNADGTSGDVYYVETNGGTPTLSINDGCLVQVDGNKLWGGVVNPNLPGNPVMSNAGDGEFKITALANYTSITIYGNAPTGGKLFLGCPPVANQQGRCGVLIEPKTNIGCDVPEYAGACNDTFRNFSASLSGSFTPIMHWNPETGDTTVLNFPPNAHFAIDTMGIAMSENYIHAQITGGTDSTGANHSRWNWTRYSYDVSPQGVPVNLVWEGIIYELGTPIPELDYLTAGMEVISDDKIVVIGKEGSTTPCSGSAPYMTVFELTYPESGNQMTEEFIMRIGGNNVDNGTTICGTLQGFAIIFDIDGNPEKLIYADYGSIESNYSIGQAVVQVPYNNNPNGDAEAISFSQDFGIEYQYNSPKGLAYYVDPNGNEKIFVAGQFNVQQYNISNPGQALPPGLIPPPYISQGEERWFGWIAEVDINPPYTWTGVSDNVMPQYGGWASQQLNQPSSEIGTFAVYGLTTLNQCSNGATGMIPITTTTTTTQPGQTTTTTTTLTPGVRTIFTTFSVKNNPS